MKEKIHCCPICGWELEQGEYELDERTGFILTKCCPNCGDIGSIVIDKEQADERFGKGFAE